jgi:hypothetical protein
MKVFASITIALASAAAAAACSSTSATNSATNGSDASPQGDDVAADSGGPNLCPNFQSLPTCAPASTADCVQQKASLGCGVDALPTGLACTGSAQCSLIVYPCPGEVQSFTGGGRTDGYVCTCVDSRWACDDCNVGAALCPEAGPPPEAGPTDAAPDSADASCPTVEQACASDAGTDANANANRCVRTWTAGANAATWCGGPDAAHALVRKYPACHGYNVVSVGFVDFGTYYYYDPTSGALAGIEKWGVDGSSCAAGFALHRSLDDCADAASPAFGCDSDAGDAAP